MESELESDSLGGNCDIDVDECASEPCKNDADCTDSAVDSDVSFHTYRCSCVAGFANGLCQNYLDRNADLPHRTPYAEYETECTVMESANPDPDCVDNTDWVDMNGNPCADYVRKDCGAAWVAALATDGVDATMACCASCGAGASYGNCDIDVDECVSEPCFNGGVCTDSTSALVSVPVNENRYRCACEPGEPVLWFQVPNLKYLKIPY